MKKYIFLTGIFAALSLLALGQIKALLLVGAGLFIWLAVETQLRRRFRFLAKHPQRESGLSLPRLHVSFVSEHSPHALLVEHGTKLTLARFADAGVQWQKEFNETAQAVVTGPGGCLYYATETELVLCDALGRDQARLNFEAPLLRQGYRLHLSQDGSQLALHTPWFIQFAEPDLSRLGQRIRYEEAGHFLKYVALAPDGRGLLLAGALLLDVDEDSSAGIEARWDYWTLGSDGAWTLAWAQSYESYNNTHLRGVAIQGQSLLAEVYQQGYEFRLYSPEGQAVWLRPGGERAQLSSDGSTVLWQNAFDELHLSRVADQSLLWKRKIVDHVRLKSVDAKGHSFLVEGRRLSVLDPAGNTLWEDWFKEDPSQLSLGPGGRLCVISGVQAGLIRVPFDV